MAVRKVYVIEVGELLDDGSFNFQGVDSVWLTKDAMRARLRLLSDRHQYRCSWFLARDYVPGPVTAELEYRQAAKSETASQGNIYVFQRRGAS